MSSRLTARANPLSFIFFFTDFTATSSMFLLGLTRATAMKDTEIALASYYQGHGNTLNGIFYDDTWDYVYSVLAVRDAYWP